jgi:hypothetical protein
MIVKDYDQTLYYEEVEYGEKVYPSNKDSKHHMATNSEIYYFKDIGKVPLFLKNFAGKIPSYVEGEISHVVKETEVNRPDLIAWKYYKNPELFWVVLAVNNIINPFKIEEGTRLRILPKSYVEYNLLRYYK